MNTDIVALAVYLRSPAAYEALKSFNILQLPSQSTLRLTVVHLCMILVQEVIV